MANIHEEPDWGALHRAAKDKMAQVDAQPPDVRRLIHEFDVNPVVQAYSLGYATVEAIRHFLRAAQRRARPG